MIASVSVLTSASCSDARVDMSTSEDTWNYHRYRLKMYVGDRLFVMEPYDDAMSNACAALQIEIQRSWGLPTEDQPALDKLLAKHVYHFGDISDWPNDICGISPAKTVPLEKPEIYFLGSLAACAHLPTHQAEIPLCSHKSFCCVELLPSGDGTYSWTTRNGLEELVGRSKDSMICLRSGRSKTLST